MAFSFNGSTHVSGTFSAVTAYPITVYCRAQSTNTTTAYCAFESGSVGADDDMHGLWFRGDTVGDPLQFRRTGPSGAGVGINSVAAYSANTWVDMGGVAAAANDGRMYANAVKSTSATSVNFVNGNVVFGGHFGLNVVSDRLNGLLCSCAIWDVALTDDEMTSLFRGFSPRRIRPQSLKLFAPMVRQFLDIRGGIGLTLTGTSTVAVHPRSYGM